MILSPCMASLSKKQSKLLTSMKVETDEKEVRFIL